MPTNSLLQLSGTTPSYPSTCFHTLFQWWIPTSSLLQPSGAAPSIPSACFLTLFHSSYSLICINRHHNGLCPLIRYFNHLGLPPLTLLLVSTPSFNGPFLPVRCSNHLRLLPLTPLLVSLPSFTFHILFKADIPIPKLVGLRHFRTFFFYINQSASSCQTCPK